MRILWLVPLLASCNLDDRSTCESWRQWGNSAGHDGASCNTGQPLAATLGDITYDPFVAQEVADAGGDLVIHYQSPLIDGDDVYMMTKGGGYTPCFKIQGVTDCADSPLDRLNSQVWTEKRYAWQGSDLVEQWSFDSDWKPEPGVGFEPMFQPALVDGLIAIPAAGGAVDLLDREGGGLVLQLSPFGGDPDTYVSGALAVNNSTIYYNAIKLDHDDPFGKPSQAFLVTIAPDSTVRVADYATLVPGAPAATDLCFGQFDESTTPLPWPPADVGGSAVLPLQFPCGPQRPGINSAPAITADGTIFVVSRAHFNARYSYIVAVNSDLTPKWATSLRGLLNDGCGVTVPLDGTDTMNFFDCRVGARAGVEPSTNLAPAATVDDDSSSSPVALPDGGVLYGSLTLYNGFRGHLVKLDATGAFTGSYDFGWDSTPSVVTLPNGDYRVVVKDNHYGEDENGVDLGPYFITSLDSSLDPQWHFLSTETQSCTRQPDGSVTCVADHPHGFEWCINAPAVDEAGTTFVNSEDGHVYAIDATGALRDKIFLDQAEGAAYTPLALDQHGRVYALNSGHLSIVGSD